MAKIECQNCGHQIYKVKNTEPALYEHYNPYWHPDGQVYTSSWCMVMGCKCIKPELKEELGCE